MFSASSALVKTKKKMLSMRKSMLMEEEPIQEIDEEDNMRTLEQMARDEKRNKDINPEKYFFVKLNDIFQQYLGATIRREFNYFQSNDSTELNLMKAMGSLDDDQLIEFGIKILKKEEDKRLFEEIVILQKIIGNTEPFLQIRATNGKQVLFQCLKNLKYKFGKIGTLLNKQGEPIKSMYIILKGMMQIKQAPKIEEEAPPAFSTRQRSNTKNLSKGQSLRAPSFSENLEDLKQKAIYLNKGMCYAEKQLFLKEEQISDSYVYFFDNCHLAYLDIQKFRTVVDESTIYQMQEEIFEFSQVNVLKFLSQKLIQTLYLKVRPFTFLRNHILTKEGEKVNSIYFIKDGEVKQTKKLVYEPEKGSKQAILEKINQYHPYHQKTTHFELAILIKGQSIGLSEYFKSKVYSATSSIYSTTATFYELSVTDFEECLFLDEEMKEKFEEYFKNEGPDIEMRQTRVSQFNQVVGKVDINSKKQEIKAEVRATDQQILKYLQEGQSMIIRSSVNVGTGTFMGSTNFDFIMSQLKEVKESRRNKMKKQDIVIKGCQFSEEDLNKISNFIYRSRRSLEKQFTQNSQVSINSHSPNNNLSVQGNNDILAKGQQSSREVQTQSNFNNKQNNSFTQMSKETSSKQGFGSLESFKEPNLLKYKEPLSLKQNFHIASKENPSTQNSFHSIETPSKLQQQRDQMISLNSPSQKGGYIANLFNKTVLTQNSHSTEPNSSADKRQHLNFSQKNEQHLKANFLSSTIKHSHVSHKIPTSNASNAEQANQEVIQLTDENADGLEFRRSSTDQKIQKAYFREEKKQRKPLILNFDGTRDINSIENGEEEEIDNIIDNEKSTEVYSLQKIKTTYQVKKIESISTKKVSSKSKLESEREFVNSQLSPTSPTIQIRSFSQLPTLQLSPEDSQYFQRQSAPVSCRNVSDFPDSQPSYGTLQGFKKTRNKSINWARDTTSVMRNSQFPSFQISNYPKQDAPLTSRSPSNSINKFLPLKYNVQLLLDPKESFLSRLCKDKQVRARQFNKKQRPCAPSSISSQTQIQQ